MVYLIGIMNDNNNNHENRPILFGLRDNDRENDPNDFVTIHGHLGPIGRMIMNPGMEWGFVYSKPWGSSLIWITKDLGIRILTMNHETWRVGVSLKQIMPLGLDY